jgi:hypothetical protein
MEAARLSETLISPTGLHIVTSQKAVLFLEVIGFSVGAQYSTLYQAETKNLLTEIRSAQGLRRHVDG